MHKAAALDTKIQRLRKSLPPLPKPEPKQQESEKKGEKLKAKVAKNKKKEITQDAEEKTVSNNTEPPEILQARKHLKSTCIETEKILSESS